MGSNKKKEISETIKKKIRVKEGERRENTQKRKRTHETISNKEKKRNDEG